VLRVKFGNFFLIRDNPLYPCHPCAINGTRIDADAADLSG
jgi:hypothetical protein